MSMTCPDAEHPLSRAERGRDSVVVDQFIPGQYPHPGHEVVNNVKTVGCPHALSRSGRGKYDDYARKSTAAARVLFSISVMHAIVTRGLALIAGPDAPAPAPSVSPSVRPDCMDGIGSEFGACSVRRSPFVGSG